VCEQGSRRPHAAVRAHWRVQVFHVRNGRRRACADPVLAMATPVPRYPAQIYQPTRPSQRPHTRPTREWDQLRELVHCRVYLPYVFSYFCSESSLFSGRVDGVWMSAWRDAELPGRSLERSLEQSLED